MLTHTHMRTCYIHTHTHMRTCSHIHAHAHMLHTRTCTHATHTHMRTCSHTHAHAHMLTHTHTCAHATHTHMHTCYTHTHTCMCMLHTCKCTCATHTHTHMHIHTYIDLLINSVHVCTGWQNQQSSWIPDKVQKGDGLSTLSMKSTELQNHIWVFSSTISNTACGRNAQSTTSMMCRNGVL